MPAAAAPETATPSTVQQLMVGELAMAQQPQLPIQPIQPPALPPPTRTNLALASSHLAGAETSASAPLLVPATTQLALYAAATTSRALPLLGDLPSSNVGELDGDHDSQRGLAVEHKRSHPNSLANLKTFKQCLGCGKQHGNAKRSLCGGVLPDGSKCAYDFGKVDAAKGPGNAKRTASSTTTTPQYTDMVKRFKSVQNAVSSVCSSCTCKICAQSLHVAGSKVC